MFRMYGRIIEIYRYKLDYTEAVPGLDENGEPIETNEERTEYFIDAASAEEVHKGKGGTITKLNTADYEWLDGLEVADVDDTYAEAVKIYEMGKEAYERKLAFEQSKKSEQLRADLDYVMLMEGL